MKHLLISVLLFTLLSCKKEEKTQEYWQQKTIETYNKLVSLSDKYTCADMPNISIKPIKEYICTSYVLVHKSDDAKFDKLLNEYEYYHKKLKEYISTNYVLVNKSEDAKFDKLINEYEYYHKKVKELGYYSTISMLCADLYPVRIDCKEGKSKIVYLQELNSEELQVEIEKLYDDIKKHYDNTSCNNPNDWLGITLLTEESVEAIALKKGDTNFNYKVSTYNQAIVRKLRSEGKAIEFDTLDKIVVKCENNKAIAEFE